MIALSYIFIYTSHPRYKWSIFRKVLNSLQLFFRKVLRQCEFAFFFFRDVNKGGEDMRLCTEGTGEELVEHQPDGGFKYFLFSPLFGEDSHFD